MDKRMQTIRITFSNGAKGEFTGLAVVDENEMENISIEGLEISKPETITDEIRQQLKDTYKDQ